MEALSGFSQACRFMGIESRDVSPLLLHNAIIMLFATALFSIAKGIGDEITTV